MRFSKKSVTEGQTTLTFLSNFNFFKRFGFFFNNVFHFQPSEASSTGIMSLESQKSRIPKLFLDPRNLVSQKYCDPRMVTPWCHPGVTMVGPKGKRECFPGPNRGQKGKGKASEPEMEPGSHWTVPPRVARTDETKRFPGWGTWRSHPPKHPQALIHGGATLRSSGRVVRN